MTARELIELFIAVGPAGVDIDLDSPDDKDLFKHQLLKGQPVKVDTARDQTRVDVIPVLGYTDFMTASGK